jgi:hypothetical protein
MAFGDGGRGRGGGRGGRDGGRGRGGGRDGGRGELLFMPKKKHARLVLPHTAFRLLDQFQLA